jgi:hypothetical protein
MKYWNKTKRSRANWTHVPVKVKYMSEDLFKLWCQRHPSKGRFYYSLGADAITPILALMHGTRLSRPDGYSQEFYFELPEDAIAFRLIHG